MVSRIATKDKAIEIMLEKAQGQTKAIKHMMDNCNQEHIEELEKQVYIICVAQLNALCNLMCSVSQCVVVQAAKMDKATSSSSSKRMKT